MLTATDAFSCESILARLEYSTLFDEDDLSTARQLIERDRERYLLACAGSIPLQEVASDAAQLEHLRFVQTWLGRVGGPGALAEVEGLDCYRRFRERGARLRMWSLFDVVRRGPLPSRDDHAESPVGVWGAPTSAWGSLFEEAVREDRISSELVAEGRDVFMGLLSESLGEQDVTTNSLGLSAPDLELLLPLLANLDNSPELWDAAFSDDTPGWIEYRLFELAPDVASANRAFHEAAWWNLHRTLLRFNPSEFSADSPVVKIEYLFARCQDPRRAGPLLLLAVERAGAYQNQGTYQEIFGRREELLEVLAETSGLDPDVAESIAETLEAQVRQEEVYTDHARRLLESWGRVPVPRAGEARE